MPLRLFVIGTLVCFLSIAQLVWSAPNLAGELESDQRLAKRDVPRVTPSSRQALSTQGMSRGMKPPEELRLNLDGRDVIIIYSTGDVRLGEGVTVDEASHDFWKKVGELAPGYCRERKEQAKKQP